MAEVLNSPERRVTASQFSLPTIISLVEIRRARCNRVRNPKR